MYCKITKSQTDGSKSAALKTWVSEKWGPLISRQEGFQGYYFIIKPEGQFQIIMLWDDGDLIRTWSDNPQHQALVPEFLSLVTAEVEMDTFEVVDRHPV